MIDFVIKFFAFIGIIILVVYLINYIVSLYKQRAANTANQRINPPPSYMQNSGIKCPDYFSNIGIDNESYNCSNRDFNINVNSPDTCYNNVTEKTMRFPKIPSGKISSGDEVEKDEDQIWIRLEIMNIVFQKKPGDPNNAMHTLGLG